jgi:hypothetical protein
VTAVPDSSLLRRFASGPLCECHCRCPDVVCSGAGNNNDDSNNNVEDDPEDHATSAALTSGNAHHDGDACNALLLVNVVVAVAGANRL